MISCLRLGEPTWATGYPRMSAVTSILCVLAAYLIGSVSFAIVASRLFRLPDPRTYGSGNPGATNVLRSGKRAAALCTLLGDIGKGFVAVAFARGLAPVLGFVETTVAACALGVFLGHLYPAYFRFQGGKGVSTALGILLGLSPWLALAASVTFVAVAALTRYASLASIVAAVIAAGLSPLVLSWGPISAVLILVAALVIWRHRSNVLRLWSGTESKLVLGRGETPPPA